MPLLSLGPHRLYLLIPNTVNGSWQLTFVMRITFNRSRPFDRCTIKSKWNTRQPTGNGVKQVEPLRSVTAETSAIVLLQLMTVSLIGSEIRSNSNCTYAYSMNRTCLWIPKWNIPYIKREPHVSYPMSTNGIKIQFGKYTLSLRITAHFKLRYNKDYSWIPKLTHRDRDKMATISHTTFSNAFSWMDSFVLWCKFHRSLFLRVQLTISEHWFR